MRILIKKIIAWRIELTVSFILFLLIVTGIELRSGADRFSLDLNNVASYYYQRSSYLNETGRLPAKDVWGFAPAAAPENIPPLLAYGTVSLYRISDWAADWGSFHDFCAHFPVIIFVVWSAVGFWIFRQLFNNYYHGLTFVFLFAVVPAGIGMTREGFYTEEALGAFLMFLAVYYLLRSSGDNRYLLPLSLSLLCLVLTWQQFPIFYAGLLAYIVLNYFCIHENKLREVGFRFLAVGLPLVCGHFISRLAIGIEYSPLSMIREILSGFINFQNREIQIAMSRSDWQGLNWLNFKEYYGILFGILVIAGLVGLIAGRNNFSKRAVLVIFGFAASVMAYSFLKARYFAFPILIFIAVGGFDCLWRRQQVESTRFFSVFLRELRRLGKAVFVNRKKAAFGGIIALAALAVLFVIVPLGIGKKPPPKPEIIFLAPKHMAVGQTRSVSVILRNTGGDALISDSAFAGFHIEVENAAVDNIRVWPGGAGDIAIKSDAWRGSLFWFEAKLPSLSEGQSGEVIFDITPFAQPIAIYYRSWLPGSCSEEQRGSVMADLRLPWRSGQNGWRNEDCIRRAPASRSAEILCPVAVYAAHQDLQDFRCFKEEIQVNKKAGP